MSAPVPFPGNNNPSRLNREDEPCRVLVLPVLRIDRDDDLTPEERRAAMTRRQRLAQAERTHFEGASFWS